MVPAFNSGGKCINNLLILEKSASDWPMNLTIDIGNTRTKIALFKENELLEIQSLDQELELESFLDSNTEIRHIILSTVGSPLNVLEFYGGSASVVHLNQDTPVPLDNKYTTPETLGTDRISNAVGATHLFPKRNILVIDAGTCITLDMVNEENQYLGGSISNGIKMRFQALNTFTENLPLIGHEDSNYPDLIGKSTESSIRSGVVNGVVGELCGMISAYNEQFTRLIILLTGGDANYIKAGLEDRADSKKK